LRKDIYLIGLLFGLGTACDASYSDLGARSEGAPISGTAAFDAGFLDDGGALAGKIIARGTWTPRAGYPASGTVEIVEHAGGIEIRFGDDFVSGGVPGPVVVLTKREDIEAAIDTSAGDLEVGRLESARGSQSYFLTEGLDDRTYVWVFCKPFGVEVARATLEVVP